MADADQIRRTMERGNEYPYDAPDGWCSDTPAPPPKDWAHNAARCVIADLTDRRAIKRGFEEIDEETRVEIVDTMAGIIRAAHA